MVALPDARRAAHFPVEPVSQDYPVSVLHISHPRSRASGPPHRYESQVQHLRAQIDGSSRHHHDEQRLQQQPAQRPPLSRHNTVTSRGLLNPRARTFGSKAAATAAVTCALAQRVEVYDGEVRIMGSKLRLLHTHSARKLKFSATQGLKWR